MSNVFSNTSFAVLSVMESRVNDDFLSATAYVQQKPEANYGNILTVSFPSAEWDQLDFNVQDRFNANVAPNIMATISSLPGHNTSSGFVEANSNISAKSYGVKAAEIT